MGRFVGWAAGLQLLLSVAAHFAPTVLLLSGILGTGIPFVLGLAYGATRPRDIRTAATGGFFIGIVAIAGVLLSVVLDDLMWIVLTYAPASAAVTGTLGAIIGMVAAGRHRAPGAEGTASADGS